jgi:hypothetical protein
LLHATNWGFKPELQISLSQLIELELRHTPS